MIINVEAQLKADPGYPLENRVVYYICRHISAEYGTVFTKSHYEKIEKVYSIWICMDPPGEKRNTIEGIKLQGVGLYGCEDDECPAPDLMCGIIINMGGSEDEVDNKILRLMNTLLSDTLKFDEKKKRLNEDFKIPMTQPMEEEAKKLCNLSEGILRKGENKGRLEGRLEGRNDLADLMKYLFSAGRIQDAERVANEPEYREEMLEKFQLQPV